LGPDFGFVTFEAHYSDDEPQRPPVVLIMWYESRALARIIEGEFEEFHANVLEGTPFEAQPYDHVSLYFYPREGDLLEAYTRYYHFRWACRLLQVEFSEVHEELFSFFSKHPEKLADLHWRGFEKLLDAVFKNNGFRTAIGPGRSDGGVDLRLYHHDAVSQLLTLVQAKRHRSQNPVTVDAVRAFA
jgi:restriction system protein